MGDVKMEKIEKFNAEKICCEKYCSNYCGYFTNIKIKDMEITLNFCEKHSQEYLKTIVKMTEEGKWN